MAVDPQPCYRVVAVHQPRRRRATANASAPHRRQQRYVRFVLLALLLALPRRRGSGRRLMSYTVVTWWSRGGNAAATRLVHEAISGGLEAGTRRARGSSARLPRRGHVGRRSEGHFVHAEADLVLEVEKELVLVRHLQIGGRSWGDRGEIVRRSWGDRGRGWSPSVTRGGRAWRSRVAV